MEHYFSEYFAFGRTRIFISEIFCRSGHWINHFGRRSKRKQVRIHSRLQETEESSKKQFFITNSKIITLSGDSFDFTISFNKFVNGKGLLYLIFLLFFCFDRFLLFTLHCTFKQHYRANIKENRIKKNTRFNNKE
jgi:hypothetical protein